VTPCSLVVFTDVSWKLFYYSWGEVRPSQLGTSAIVSLLYQRIISDRGAFGGIRIGRGNRITRRKPVPLPLYPPKISHDLAWHRTLATVEGSQQHVLWHGPSKEHTADVGSAFLRNVGKNLSDYTTSHLRRRYFFIVITAWNSKSHIKCLYY
jgi:hypothetical protein